MAFFSEVSVYTKGTQTANPYQKGENQSAEFLVIDADQSVQSDKQKREMKKKKTCQPSGKSEEFPFFPISRLNFMNNEQY